MFNLFHVFGAWFLRRRIATVGRQVGPPQSAQDVLVVFADPDAGLRHRIQEVEQVFSRLGLRVEKIGYFSDTALHDDVSFTYFNNNEITWLGRPKGDWVQKLMSRHWKYVLDLSLMPQLPLSWLVSLMKAEVRLGLFDAPRLYDIVMKGHSGDLTKLPVHLEALLSTLKAKVYANT